MEIQAAIIGVLGTLFGTILGFALNGLSQKGKLNLYVNNCQEKFMYNSKGIMVPSTSMEQTEYFEYTIGIDIYNSSSSTKIMRGIEVLFMEDKTVLHRDIPDCEVNDTNEGLPIGRVVNIPAKTVQSLKINNGFWSKEDEQSFIWQANRVVFIYKDEKNKEKRIEVRCGKYIETFGIT